MPVTLEQVARRANVSLMTVSNVLNGRHSPTRPHAIRRAAKIRQLAADMGYRPNAAARSTRTGRHHAVSLIMSEFQHRSVLSSETLRGLHAGCRDHRLLLVVSQMPDDRLVDEGYIPRILRESLVDGLLINYSAEIPQPMIDLIDRYRITAAWINSQQPFNCIYPDDLSASIEATGRLLDLGHRRIAYLDYTSSAFQPIAHYSFAQRWEGHRQTLEALGLRAQRHGSVEALSQKWRMLEEIKALLDSPDRPTALLCYGPREARTAIVAAVTLGLDVPRDLSVMMFADNGAYDEMGIHIATMIVPNDKVGRGAVDLLVRRIADPALRLDPIKVPFGFKAEQTLAPAPIS